MNASASRATRRGCVLVAALLAASPAAALAQGEGPLTYLPMPVGRYLVTPSYMRLGSNLNFTGEILLGNADVTADIVPVSFQATFGVKGRFAEIWLIPMWGSVGGEVTTGSTTVSAPSVSGFADPYVAARIGLVGAPALRLADFVKHRQSVQLYLLAGASMPIGQYDPGRPLNLGTNRWAFRVGLPLVVPLTAAPRATNLEIHPSVYFYTNNTEPTGGAALREQNPLFVVESHLTRHITRRIWGALDGRYQYGGETTTDGVPDGNRNSRFGAGASLGYDVSPRLTVFAGYGGVIAEGDGSRGTMFRARVIWFVR